MSKPDLRKQYLQLAYDQLHPKTSDLVALQQVLVNWFCLTFRTTPNDERLMGMRLDELLLFRMMHEIKENPAVMDEVGSQGEDYEAWLKQEMGTDYKSVEQMVDAQEKLEDQEKKLAAELPDKIDTDFTAIRGE